MKIDKLIEQLKYEREEHGNTEVMVLNMQGKFSHIEGINAIFGGIVIIGESYNKPNKREVR